MSPNDNTTIEDITVDIMTSSKPDSTMVLPAQGTYAVQSTVDTPATSRWSSLTCCVIPKACHRIRSVTAALGHSVDGSHQTLKPMSSVYIICLLLAHVVHVSSSSSSSVDTSSCGRPRLAMQVIRYQNCNPKRLLNSVCSGTCRSYAKPDPEDPTFIQHECNCCQIGRSTMQRVRLRCPSPDGERRFVQKALQVRVINSCSCRPCSVLPDIQTGEYL